jgi:hypothetical protein
MAAKQTGLRVAISWRETLLRELHLRPGQRLRVGTAPKNDVLLSGPHHPARHVLLGHDPKRGWCLYWLPSLDGSLARGGRVVPCSEFGARPQTVALGPMDWGTLQAGELSVLFQPGPAAKAPRARRAFAIDERVVAALCVAFLIEAGVLVAAALGGSAAADAAEPASASGQVFEATQPELAPGPHAQSRSGDGSQLGDDSVARLPVSPSAASLRGARRDPSP